MFTPMFERDLLYPADVPSEPGSVHVKVLSPDIRGKLPILILPKTSHNPLDYVDTLINILQLDVFERAHIDIKSQGIFFFKLHDDEYIKLVYEEGKKIKERTTNIMED